jgi:hypothetical protein
MSSCGNWCLAAFFGRRILFIIGGFRKKTKKFFLISATSEDEILRVK